MFLKLTIYAPISVYSSPRVVADLSSRIDCFRRVTYANTHYQILQVLTRQNSRWYKIILLIQQSKTSAMYIIKTQDRAVLESLSSTCPKEVRDKIQFIGNLILGKPQSSPIYLAFYCKFIHFEHQHNSCTMKNYHINYIL